MTSVALVAAANASGTAAQTSADGRAALGSAIGSILQADGPAAKRTLKAIADTDLAPADRSFRDCALAALDGATFPGRTGAAPVPDGRAGRPLEAYRAYWVRSVGAPGEREAAERALVAQLSAVLGGTAVSGMDEAEARVRETLKAEGFHSLQGRTGRLRELMIWTSETTRTERVALPEGESEARVTYLDGFISRGWSSHFTCGRTGSGGWTTDDGLFVVVPAYASLADENFRVNFLAHESQHFADKRRFAGLADWELEYRAKLAEVALAETTVERVLRGFASNVGDDPADAHSYANRRVLAALRARLGLDAAAELAAAPRPDLKAAAVAELKADSARRSGRS